MFNLVNQAINFVANIDYGRLAVKAVVKTAEFVVVNGIEIIKWINQ